MEKIWPLKPNQSRTGLNLISNTIAMANPKTKFYSNSEFISFKWRGDKKRIQPMLPFCLRADGEIVFFVAKHGACAFGDAYNEAGVLLKVWTLIGPAYFFAWAVVNSDSALILGRELLGVPKKMAEIEIDDQSFHIKRKESTNIQCRYETLETSTAPYPIFGRQIVNAGGLGQFFLTQPLWTYKSPEHIICANSVHHISGDFHCEDLKGILPESLSKGQKSVSDIYNSRFILPVGLTGPGWLARNYTARYR